MNTHHRLYKQAFLEYLRNGTPIELSLKQARVTTHYIWRTRGDGKVRPSHAANNGRIFAWEDPPPTGHPGEDYGCRCRAEPHVINIANTSENLTITLSGVSDTGPTLNTKIGAVAIKSHNQKLNGTSVTNLKTEYIDCSI